MTNMEPAGATHELPLPAPMPGTTWRALTPDDAQALAQLAAVSGDQLYHSAGDLAGAAETLAADTLSAWDAAGGLVAYAWVTFDDGFVHERRAFLDGMVRPDRRGRGLGRFLITWMEARARTVWASVPDERAGVLRLDFKGQRDAGAIALFEQMGYRFAMAEEEMRRDLRRPLPDLPQRTGVRLESWTDANGSLFYQVYVDAFASRPGFPNWSEATWRAAFTGDASFRPDLSMLLWTGDQPAGYVLCAVAGDEGWIPQIGIRPAYRKQGLASLLLGTAMRRFRDSGLSVAVLEVNTNNPEAASVYRRLGFVTSSRYTSYRKTLSAI